MIPNMQWAHDVMTGQKSFPTFYRKGEDKGFKELLEKEMKKLEVGGNGKADHMVR